MPLSAANGCIVSSAGDVTGRRLPSHQSCAKTLYYPKCHWGYDGKIIFPQENGHISEGVDAAAMCPGGDELGKYHPTDGGRFQRQLLDRHFLTGNPLPAPGVKSGPIQVVPSNLAPLGEPVTSSHPHQLVHQLLIINHNQVHRDGTILICVVRYFHGYIDLPAYHRPRVPIQPGRLLGGGAGAAGSHGHCQYTEQKRPYGRPGKKTVLSVLTVTECDHTEFLSLPAERHIPKLFPRSLRIYTDLRLYFLINLL